MGNTPSVTDNEDAASSHHRDDDLYYEDDVDSSDSTTVDSEINRTQREENPTTGPSSSDADEKIGLHHWSDLSLLFDPKSLRAFASKLKDEVPVNVIQQHHTSLVRWLETAVGRNEETISLTQFCDFLMNRSVDRDQCIRAFQQFDSEGDGSADVSAMLEALKTSSSPDLHGELNYVVRTLQACSLIPGFIDVYAEEKTAGGLHGNRILNFLVRNRASSTALPFPVLDRFNNTSSMRRAVLNSMYSKLNDTVGKQILSENLLGGEELKPITKTFSRLEVSSNAADCGRLTNGDFGSYWQSDGLARSHWIRLWMKNSVVLKQLSIGVSSSDQSYMPQVVAVSVGRSPYHLQEIKEVKIPNHFRGDIVLVDNLQSFYKVIQITIRRCQSDGCDTRIRGIKTLGYRIVKEHGFSLLDASAIWYLKILATTVSACRIMAPHLRLSVLEHSKDALMHMPPLSLSSASGERPTILSTHVLDEIDSFLWDVAMDGQGQVSAEGLHVLLAFSLARGHVASILKILQSAVENNNLLVAHSSALIQSMTKVRDNFMRKTASQLQMTLLGSDAGSKDDHSTPQLVLTSAWVGPAAFYRTKEGKTMANMFFKGLFVTQLVKLRIKVEKGAKGPKSGLVFVYNCSEEEFDLDKHVARFASYDSWRATEYNAAVAKRRSGENNGSPDDPVAFFQLEDEWDEVEVILDAFPTGQFILVKFLEPRQSIADCLGILGIRFYGFCRKDFQILEFKQAQPAEGEEGLSNSEMVQQTLMFLKEIATEQAVVKKGVLKTQWLDTNKLNIDSLWCLYRCFVDIKSEGDMMTQVLLLQLLHALLPHLSAIKQDEKVQANAFFEHLCELLDTVTDSNTVRALTPVVKQVMVDGVSVFFPDKEARRKKLFGMIDDISETSDTAPSVQLIFQSLCQFYSTIDPTGLLDLPKTVQDDFDPEPFLSVMDTLICVVMREFKVFLDTSEMTEQSAYLISLVSSLQTSLLAWCQRILTKVSLDNEKEEESKTNRKVIEPIVVRYSSNFFSKSCEGLELLSKKSEEELRNLVEKMDQSVFSTSLRQLTLLISSLSKLLEPQSSVKLAKNVLCVAGELKKISSKLPKLFELVSSEKDEDVGVNEVILRTWNEESHHNYHNNQHVTRILYCPGATKFVVDFDVRCETERRYDYLEFTDARGYKVRYDQKVGSEKWPKQVTFRGPHLQFLFHSDSSTTEWGYKFEVAAKGCPDMPLNWMYDLHLGVCKLMGQLCGEILDCRKVIPKGDPLGESKGDSDVHLLRSELWTALFRGGYRVGKLQRSLSGKFHADELDSAVHSFLWEVFNKEGELATGLLNKCHEHCRKSHQLGGEDVDAVVRATFASLLWHNQMLREEIDRYISSSGEMKVNEGIYQAYTAAESVRNHLLDLRQRNKLAQERDNSTEEPVDIVLQFKEKALYLLSFAGLTKFQPKAEVRAKPAKMLHKKSTLNRRSSLVGLEKQAIWLESPVREKYPSFRLVLDFIRDPVWCKEKVHELLQQRCQHAQCVADVYILASEFIKVMSDQHIFQIPTIMFLQDLLKNQHNFSKHYAEGIEGCGLHLESRVRQSYYSLLKRFIESLDGFSKTTATGGELSAYDFLRACLLHFLDVNWQPYDYSFINEMKIPKLFMDIAKGSVATRNRGTGNYKEEEELKDYEKNMKWLEDCKDDFSEWHNQIGKNENKAVHMFVARFCDLLDVEIGCDGCHATLPGRRYRCLQCDDIDLCTTCFAGGVSPTGEHSDDHEMVHLMFKCDACSAFIVGQRLHCEVCDDFDLCLGCHKMGKFPLRHSSGHSVKKYPMMTFTTSKKCGSTLQAYIHQHVWLLFTSLTLKMANIVYTHPTGLDSDYLATATEIHQMCTMLVTTCLEQVPRGDQLLHEDSLVADPLKTDKLEIAFALHSQERIMGLIGSMILAEHVPFSFHTESFLRLLFLIARGESSHEINTEHLAMGLLGHLLQRLTKDQIKVCDNAVAAAGKVPVSEEEKEGRLTIKYLFSFGARCLERSSLDWAYSVSSILQQLFNSTTWKEVLLDHFRESLQELTVKPDLSSIFALIVVAGFPEFLSVGTNVKCTIYGLEPRNGVVLKHFPEKRQTLVIDKATRRRHMIIDEFVDVHRNDVQILDDEYAGALAVIIRNIVGKLQEGSVDEVGVENLWVLGLSLKALLKAGWSCRDDFSGSPYYQVDFVRCIVHLACRGTDFEKIWLFKDLEVLTLMLFTADRQHKPVHHKFSKGENELKDLASNLTDEPRAAAKETIELLSGYARICAQALQATLNTTSETMNDNPSASDILQELARRESVEREGLNLPDELEALKKTMNMMSKSPSKEKICSSEAEKVVDTGIQLFGTLPDDGLVMFPSPIEAIDEPCEKSQSLVVVPDNDVKKDFYKQRKQKSMDLLEKALEGQGNVMSKEYLMKVNLAIAVLYAREVLIGLLADWPAGDQMITAELLGCNDSSQIPCVIDMLNRADKNDTINKLVENLVQSCEPDCLVAIGMTACHFLNELSMMSIVKESEHPYPNNWSFAEKVQIPGAMYLSIKFDKSCVTEEACDELILSTSSDFKHDKHVFSGPKDRWGDLELPGETLYYKFSSDCSNNDWGYKFTVTGGKTGRFDTGYMILNAVLSKPDKTRLLPLDKLWASLIQVACRQSGIHRLKIIQLLLHMLHIQCGLKENSTLIIDLCLLQPLWHLYCRMSNEPLEPGTISSPLVRSLTELFFVAESLALDKGISTMYAASLKTKEEWKETIIGVIQNVSAIRTVIGLDRLSKDPPSGVKKSSDLEKA